MHIASRLAFAGAAVALSSCATTVPEPRGATYAHYAGTVQVIFTNASPDPMCGLYMSFDDDDTYGDNWLPEGGVAAGASVQFRVKSGKYKARWDTCKLGKAKPYYAATLWREMAVSVDQQTQLYAYVADKVAPTARAATMDRDYQVVRFPGQPIDRNPVAQPPPRTSQQQVALLAATPEPPQIAGFVGRVLLSREDIAARDTMFDAQEFIEPGAKLTRPQPKAAKVKAPPPPRPSLGRGHDLTNTAATKIDYRRR